LTHPHELCGRVSVLFTSKEGFMIDVTRMNGSLLTINNHLIEMVEETPDTVITLTTGKKIIVKESRQEVKNLVKLYEKEITCNS
jgi:flagellar protein FlbD